MTLTTVFFRQGPCLLVLLCLFAVGCSKNMIVQGTVTYSDTGEPVKSGLVVFTGTKDIGRGVIKDGKYSVGLINDGDGIPPGTYTVSSDAFPVPAMDRGPSMSGNPLPPPENQEVYYTESPQTVEVTKPMTFDFTVERGVRPKPGT